MAILEFIYLLASVSFIFGMKMLGSPKSARNGNLIAAAGMTLAILATLIFPPVEISGIKWIIIISSIGLGTIFGLYTAKKVAMTKMPELVSLFNGMGGACAALIGLIEYKHQLENNGALGFIFAGLIIGSISFSGSMVAWAKLNGSFNKNIRYPLYGTINTILIIAISCFTIWMVLNHEVNLTNVMIILSLSLLYGILFVIPIGGADMPVVISLLNSFTGLAAAFGGFLYTNKVMLTGGILVGASGTILTILMCKAMNRSLSNVLFGGFGNASEGMQLAEGLAIKETTTDDLSIILKFAERVVIVPGYGLATAQAQKICKELEQEIEHNGGEVCYAIHPVAGRMPGHMNVLLAEADVSYDKLFDLEEANQKLNGADVAIIVGANDVVNPAAKEDPSSPIYGMPILEVEKAKHVIVLKRGMGKGYAGIENLLFYKDNCKMLFGDAKTTLNNLVKSIKEA